MASNPDLNQERAGVRAQDENIPRATAGWRPTVNATGQFGYNYLDTTQGGAANPWKHAADNRRPHRHENDVQRQSQL